MVFVYLKNALLSATSQPSNSNPRLNFAASLPSNGTEIYNNFSNSLRHSTTNLDSSSESWYSEDPLLNEKSSSSSSQHAPTNGRFDPRVLSDAIIGLSDGLTVPFALTAGLSAFGSTKVVIFGGLAELIAGAISMGLGGYLAARSEAEAYTALSTSTHTLVTTRPRLANALIQRTLLATIPNLPTATLSSHPSSPDLTTALTKHLISTTSPAQKTAFLLHHHHHATAPTSPNSSRTALFSAATIAGAYFVGGFVPLAPYFVAADVARAFAASVAVMVVALFAFGVVRVMVCEGGEGAWEGLEGLEDADADEDEGGSAGAGGAGGGFVGGEPGFRAHARSSRAETLRWAWKCALGGGQMVLLGGVAAGAAMGLVRAFS